MDSVKSEKEESKVADSWMEYTKSRWFGAAYDVCPRTDHHARDEFCSVCMCITRALGEVYRIGNNDGWDEALAEHAPWVLPRLVPKERT